MADFVYLWRWLLARLDAQKPAALLIVVDSVGSSPGKIGAKMAVDAESTVGTIGGGMIEAGLIKTARTLLIDLETEAQIIRRAHYTSKTIQGSGMICGGEQTVLIYPCRQADKAALGLLLESCSRRTPLTLHITPQGLQALPYDAAISTAIFQDGENWCYRENSGFSRRAFVIGGGHVGLALSKILDTLNFDISVIDERDTLDTLQANHYARHKYRIPYTDIEKHIPEGDENFVFIMTHSHRSDQQVLAKLTGKRLAYLGLLGSRHKIDYLRQTLADQLTDAQWQTLHAPMGLAIASHTPEEIAISIAAEVIQTINAKI